MLGRPVAHSLSPILHRAAWDALGLDGTYETIDCGADDLAPVLAARSGWSGFSCTMPLKHAAMSVATQVRPAAMAVGSANTLLPLPDGGWAADNTDVDGIAAALGEYGANVGLATVLGGGGTAQAAVVALARLGVRKCNVLVRDRSRASGVLDAAQRAGLLVFVSELTPTEPALRADLVISTLPPGAADGLAQRRWWLDQAIMDVVYDGWPTPLARAAADADATVISGALVLLHQAAAQVTLMTGQPAPVDAMRSALRRAAPGCGV